MRLLVAASLLQLGLAILSEEVQNEDELPYWSERLS